MADDSLTILARLVAQDAASPTINLVIKSVDKLDKQADTTRRGLLGLGRATDENRISLTKMEAAVNGAVTAFAGLKTVQFLSQMVQHGEEVRKTTNTYVALTGSVQEAEATLRALQARTHGMVNDTQLMAGAADLLKTGLAGSNGEAVKLLGLATDLGASTQQLFSVLANQSVEVLDSFGVASGAVRELKNEFMAAGMSSEEAFKEAFLVEAQKTVERLGDSIEQNISPSQQLATRWQNFWDTQSSYAAQTLNTAITSAEQLAFILGATFDESISRWRDIFEQIGISPEVRGGQTPFYVDMSNMRPSNAAPGYVSPEDKQAQQEADARQFFQSWMEQAQGGVNDWQEKLQVALDAAAEASREQARAAEANTLALQRQADTITDTIARMMGWTPPEQRALETAQTEVAGAWRDANFSPAMMDMVMQNFQTQLPQLLEMGFPPNEATYMAAGVTPGAGGTPFTVKPGDTVSGLAAQLNMTPEQVMAATGISNPRLLQPGSYNASGAKFTGQREMQMTPTGPAFYQEMYTDTDVARDLKKGASPWTNAFSNMMGLFTQPWNAPAGAGMDLPWGMDLNAAYGGRSVPQIPGRPTSFWNAYMMGLEPGQVPHSPSPIPTSGFMPPIQQYPAGMGNMDTTLSAYPAGMGNMDSQQLAQDTQLIADNAGIAADPQHLGAWAGLVTETTSEIADLQAGVDKVAQTHKITFDVAMTPTSRDKLSQWVFEILRSAGVNVAGGKIG